MALGKSNRVDGKAFSLKLATKRDGAFLPKPEWEVSVKQADGEYKTFKNEELKDVIGVEGPLHDVAGDLIGIDTRVGSYEDSPIYNVSLNLRDSTRNEVYFTGFSIGSIMGRKLANAVLNLKAFDDVQIGLYNQTNKETRKVYGNVALRQGNDTATVKGKFDFKTDPNLQPRTYEGKIGKDGKPQIEKDWSRVDLFLYEQLKAMGESFRANKKVVTNEPVNDSGGGSVSQVTESPATEENLDEDVPF